MRRMHAAAALAAVAALAAGCGDDDFENDPRPPVAVELTGVIKKDSVSVQPSKLGAGPVVITVSNQTDDSHTIVLEGKDEDSPAQRRQVGPVNPLDTGTIQATLEPGEYVVKAGSEKAVEAGEEIQPATLTIGDKRKSGSDELLLP